MELNLAMRPSLLRKSVYVPSVTSYVGCGYRWEGVLHGRGVLSRPVDRLG